MHCDLRGRPPGLGRHPTGAHGLRAEARAVSPSRLLRGRDRRGRPPRVASSRPRGARESRPRQSLHPALASDSEQPDAPSERPRNPHGELAGCPRGRFGRRRATAVSSSSACSACFAARSMRRGSGTLRSVCHRVEAMPPRDPVSPTGMVRVGRVCGRTAGCHAATGPASCRKPARHHPFPQETLDIRPEAQRRKENRIRGDS
jgi:hypothetical protein